MAENNIKDLEKEIIKTLAGVTGRDPEEFKPEASFYDDLGVDSIKAIEIVVAMERQYKIKIRDEQVPKIATVKQAVEIVRNALNKKQNEKT